MTNKVNSFQVQGNKYGIEPDYVFDNTPTQGSTNPVTSNGIYEAINGVSLGSSVSYGRADGSPVGYCSIAYGTNNIASGDYSISIGKNNRVYNINSIACGVENSILGSGYACVDIGSYNKISAVQTCTALGYNNQIGTSVSVTPTQTGEWLDNVFTGYFNPQTKKLYFDPEMQNEKQITLKDPNNASTYILDLTDMPSIGRNPGDMYEYNKSYTSLTVSYTQNTYVTLIDASANTLYIYNGICYYDNSNDKNYVDAARTQEINTTTLTSSPHQNVWFDMVSGEFIERCPWNRWGRRDDGAYKPGGGDYPKWAKVNVYRGMVSGPKEDKSGVHAYVNTDTRDGSHYGIPYSTADHIEGTELYNELIDGEIVVDIATGQYWLYRFDIQHNVVFAINLILRRISDITEGPLRGRSALALGQMNYTTGQQGSIVAGLGNNIYGYSEGSCVLGHYNILSLQYGKTGQCGTFISGISNRIYGGSVLTHTYALIGQGNHLDVGPQADRQFAIGCYNTFYQTTGGYDVHVYGEYNTLRNTLYSKLIGDHNYLCNLGYTNVIGSSNYIGDTVLDISVRVATLRHDGIIEGTGISYNSTSKTYTIETDVVYNLYTSVRTPEGTKNQYIRSIRSFDGSTFTTVEAFRYDAKLNVFGTNNYFKIRADASGMGNTILGSYNTIVGSHSLNNVTLVGSCLLCDYGTNDTEEDYGIVFTGGMNSMSGITGASFIVGNGTGSYTSDVGRSNGLVVYRTGAVAAPTAPDTIDGGVTAMANTGTSSDKMLITYAQMRDYTGPGGGGSSRPVATIITLLSTDWSSFEQTIQVSGVDTDSIVIIQPSGSAYAFNHDDIFLKAQANGELTFGCSAGPTVDIDVKVVYWA